MKFSNPIQDISIDCIILSFVNNEINVLLIKHALGESIGEWGLPGGYVRYDENLDDAASRTLKLHTGLENIYLEQLRTFGDVNRYPDRRVITVSYIALVNYDDSLVRIGETATDIKWVPIDRVQDLIFDHNEILEFGRLHLQHKVRHEPIGFNLLPETFTLLQLQSLYEAILETRFDKPNFRRKLIRMSLLIDTNEKQKNVSHRAANLFRFDEEAYHRLKEKGYTFDL